jgi:hypothetical protein
MPGEAPNPPWVQVWLSAQTISIQAGDTKLGPDRGRSLASLADVEQLDVTLRGGAHVAKQGAACGVRVGSAARSRRDRVIGSEGEIRSAHHNRRRPAERDGQPRDRGSMSVR